MGRSVDLKLFPSKSQQTQWRARVILSQLSYSLTHIFIHKPTADKYGVQALQDIERRHFLFKKQTNQRTQLFRIC